MGENSTRFVIDVDASKGVRAYEQLAGAEKKAAQDLRELARAAGTADAAVAKAAKQAQAYELAGERAWTRRASPLPRTSADGYVRPGPGGGYNLAFRQPAAMPLVAPTNLTYRTDEESFQRFLKARALKAQRRRSRSRPRSWTRWLSA